MANETEKEALSFDIVKDLDIREEAEKLLSKKNINIWAQLRVAEILMEAEKQNNNKNLIENENDVATKKSFGSS